MLRNTRQPKAFTLIEVLVFVGILLMLTGFAVVVALPQIKRTRGDGVAKELTSAIYSVQQSAYSGLEGKSHGVRFGTTTYDVFVGDSWDQKETFETFTLSSGGEILGISLTGGVAEIVFEAESIFPSAYGELVVEGSPSNYYIVVNSAGLIDYETR